MAPKSTNLDRAWIEEDEDLEEPRSALRGILLAVILSIPLWAPLAVVSLFEQ